MKKLLFAILAVISFAASATTTFEWEYSDVSPYNLNPPPATLVAHGLITVAGDGLVFEKITSFSGDVNGHEITSLVASSGADANVFQLASPLNPLVSLQGVTFEVQEIGQVNLYNGGFFTPIFYEYAPSGIPTGANVDNGIRVYLSARVAPALPVPEPSTYTMVLLGLGLLGFVTGRRRA